MSQPQVMYTRSGPGLNLEPDRRPDFHPRIVPTWNEYFSDTWRVRPDLTLTYGLGYAIEMPPYELEGKQVHFVDSANQPVSLASFLEQKQKAALAGQVYEPTIGFSTTPNVAGGGNILSIPFYGEFSPRVAVAWNPRIDNGLLGRVLGGGKTVFRGGYARIYGRLNGGSSCRQPRTGRRTGAGGAVHRRQRQRTVPWHRRSEPDHGVPHRNGRFDGAASASPPRSRSRICLA